MPTLKELFKEKILSSSGKTAEQTYKVRNSKEVPISSTVPLLNSTVFPFVQKNLRENPTLTNTKKETVLESELVGLRALKTLSFPVTYSREILRLSRQTTNMLEFMKTAANGGESALASFERSGVIGKVIDKAEKLAEGALATLGIELPQKLIPSRIAYNQLFREGLEPDTMATLAKIRKDGKGNLVGKFLQKNINIGPPKMKIKVGGAIIADIKKNYRKKLFGSPLIAAQNLARKDPDVTQYDSESPYSSGVLKGSGEILLRNDLSSLLIEKITLEKSILGGVDTSEKITSGLRPNLLEAVPDKFPNPNPFETSTKEVIKNIGIKNRDGLAVARKSAQRELAKPENNSPTFQYNKNIPYSKTIDESIGNEDVKLRNDLSTKLDSLLADRLNKGILGGEQSGSLNRKNEINPLPTTIRQSKYGERVNGSSPFNSPTLDEKLIGGEVNYGSGGDTVKVGDFINSKPPYQGEDLILGDGTTLDSKDFIPVKFTTLVGAKKSVNFTAIISGINETFSPNWESGKFLGSPFEYYNYTGVGRSVSFDLELFSLNPSEHVIMWQKIDFLTSLVYPLGYDTSSTFVKPPIIAITIGDMYVKKMCHISSLSYAVDDEGGWEIGNLINDTSKKTIYGNEVDLKNYKLPKIVKVSITLQFMENRNNTETKKYGYNPITFTNDAIKNIN
jgi:hypothetical protein